MTFYSFYLLLIILKSRFDLIVNVYESNSINLGNNGFGFSTTKCVESNWYVFSWKLLKCYITKFQLALCSKALFVAQLLLYRGICRPIQKRGLLDWCLLLIPCCKRDQCQQIIANCGPSKDVYLWVSLHWFQLLLLIRMLYLITWQLLLLSLTFIGKWFTAGVNEKLGIVNRVNILMLCLFKLKIVIKWRS